MASPQPTSYAPRNQGLSPSRSSDSDSAVEKHMERVRENPWRPASSTNGIFIAGSKGRPVSTTFRAYVAWLTEQEVPRNDVAHDVVRHSMAHDGMRRTKPRSTDELI